MPHLTVREQEVLSWLSLGYSTKLTGEMLGLKEFTVKSYKREMFDKLGADNAPHAVYLGFKYGFLRVPEPVREGTSASSQSKV